MPVRCWNSHAQNTLHCHCMAAIAPILEKTAGAVPLAIVKNRGMGIVLTPERCFKASKLNPLRFGCITLGFGDLIDHT